MASGWRRLLNGGRETKSPVLAGFRASKHGYAVSSEATEMKRLRGKMEDLQKELFACGNREAQQSGMLVGAAIEAMDRGFAKLVGRLEED